MGAISNFFEKLRDDNKRNLLFLAFMVITLPINMNLNAFAITLFTLNALFSFKLKNIETDKRALMLYSFYILFFISSALSLLYSEDQATGMVKLQTKLSFLFVPLAFIASLRTIDREMLRWIFRVFILSVLWCTVLCFLESIVQAIITLNLRELTDSYLSNPLMHRAYLSIFIGIAILLWWEDKEFMKKSRKIWIAFFVITVILLQGRINILALFAVSVAMIAVRYFNTFALRQKLLAVGIGVALIAGFVLVPKEYNRFNEPLTFEYDFSKNQDKDFTGLTIRLAIWHNAIPIIKENPVLGVGIGDSKAALVKNYFENNFTKGKTKKFNCHNQYPRVPSCIRNRSTIVNSGIGHNLSDHELETEKPIFSRHSHVFLFFHGYRILTGKTLGNYRVYHNDPPLLQILDFKRSGSSRLI